MNNLRKSYIGCWWSLWIAIGILIAALLTSCKSEEPLIVPEVHEIHHHHTDSIHETDSIIHERETTIMQLDSAAMAKYGIQLKNAERAWLVKTHELERQIERIMAMRNDSIVKHDSIPYPVDRPVSVPRDFSWSEKTLMKLGWAMLTLIAVAIMYLISKIKKKL
jgi:hypothetical protein